MQFSKRQIASGFGGYLHIVKIFSNDSLKKGEKIHKNDSLNSINHKNDSLREEEENIERNSNTIFSTFKFPSFVSSTTISVPGQYISLLDLLIILRPFSSVLIASENLQKIFCVIHFKKH